MKTIQQAIEVRVSLHQAYQQLTHPENYPRFMTGVCEVREFADRRTHWVMDIDGERREFDATLDRRLDERVAWQVTDGPRLAEAITLRQVSAGRTQVIAELQADAEAHAEESLSRRLKADLAGFKRFCEQQSSDGGPGWMSPRPAG